MKHPNDNYLRSRPLNKVTVKLHTRLRSTVGKEKVELKLSPDCDLECMLKQLGKEYPRLNPLLKGEYGYKHLMILINNSHVGPISKEILEKKIGEEDIVSILEPSAAG